MDIKTELTRNRGILENIKSQRADLQDPTKPVAQWMRNLFPGESEAQVRTKMIVAKTADVENYEHIVAQYESGNV